jgi:hypothetical protein
MIYIKIRTCAGTDDKKKCRERSIWDMLDDYLMDHQNRSKSKGFEEIKIDDNPVKDDVCNGDEVNDEDCFDDDSFVETDILTEEEITTIVNLVKAKTQSLSDKYDMLNKDVANSKATTETYMKMKDLISDIAMYNKILHKLSSAKK